MVNDRWGLVCEIDGCTKPVWVRERMLCQSHGQAYYRRNKKVKCSHGDCDNPMYAKGLCGKHYARKRLGKPLDDRVRPEIEECSFEGCIRPRRSHAFELCRSHGQQVYLGMTLQPIQPRPGYTENGKVCTKCNKEKPLDQFYVKTRTSQGLPPIHSGKCRRCYIDSQAASKAARKNAQGS